MTPTKQSKEEKFDKIKRCCFRKYGNGDSRFKVLKPLIEDLLKAKEKQVERKLDNILREYRNRLKIGNISEANVRRITMVINKLAKQNASKETTPRDTCMGDDAYDILKGSCSDLTCYHQIPPCSGCRRMFGKEDNE